MFEEDMKIDMYERKRKQRRRAFDGAGPRDSLPVEAAAGGEPMDLEPPDTALSSQLQSSAAIDDTNSRHISPTQRSVSQAAYGFTCQFPGCSAGPFARQYLLE